MGSVIAGDSTRFRPHGAQVYVLRRLKRFSLLVCHRGWGKTTLCVNYLTEQATATRDGRYAYLGPLYRQVKQAAWDALREAASGAAEFSESELVATFPNDARIQLFGADNYQALRGMHLDGIVLDEYGDIHPNAWTEVIRPALAAKRGFAVFIGTPKGRNHFYQLYEDTKRDPDWFNALYRFADSGVIGALSGDAALAEVEAARRDMTTDHFAQEYECSFEAALSGAYYARELEQARSQRRVRVVPWEPTAEPVETFWDLGFFDETAIIFTQRIGREMHLIDYYESKGQALSAYAKVLQERPYTYGRHHLPHDGGAKTLASGGIPMSEQLTTLGVKPMRVHLKNDPLDGINQARLLFPRLWFDEIKCAGLLDALANYRADYDEKKRTFKPEPRHDWASHGADAFRLMACTLRLGEDAPRPKTRLPSHGVLSVEQARKEPTGVRW